MYDLGCSELYTLHLALIFFDQDTVNRMAKLIVYYAHPRYRHSVANKTMLEQARLVKGITVIDLYAEYPRFGIHIDEEQQRLLDHDVILFQFPLFWYSTPSLVKEWIDLVLEHGFAYGAGGDKLTGKHMMVALTAAGSRDAYTPEGYQRFELRTFLTPLEQTARLCHMEFTAPYVLYSSLDAPEISGVNDHAVAYKKLLEAIRDDRYDFQAAAQRDVITFSTLPILEEA